MRSGAFRFSIRGVLLAAAVLALGLATLPYSSWSGFWAIVLATLVLALFTFAVLAGVFRRGPSQAYWAGFAIAGVGYLILVLWILGKSENDGVGRLATTRLLQKFESLVRHEVTLEPGVKVVKGLSVYPTFNADGILRDVAVVPNHGTLMLSGQLLWSLLIGYAGGVVARYLYLTREPAKATTG